MSDRDESGISFFRENKLRCINSEDCTENEKCVKISEESAKGICECVLGYKRNLEGNFFFNNMKHNS